MRAILFQAFVWASWMPKDRGANMEWNLRDRGASRMAGVWKKRPNSFAGRIWASF